MNDEIGIARFKSLIVDTCFVTHRDPSIETLGSAPAKALIRGIEELIAARVTGVWLLYVSVDENDPCGPIMAGIYTTKALAMEAGSAARFPQGTCYSAVEMKLDQPVDPDIGCPF
jgi:hypothetical protein